MPPSLRQHVPLTGHIKETRPIHLVTSPHPPPMTTISSPSRDCVLVALFLLLMASWVAGVSLSLSLNLSTGLTPDPSQYHFFLQTQKYSLKSPWLSVKTNIVNIGLPYKKSCTFRCLAARLCNIN